MSEISISKNANGAFAQIFIRYLAGAVTGVTIAVKNCRITCRIQNLVCVIRIRRSTTLNQVNNINITIEVEGPNVLVKQQQNVFI